MSFTPPEMRSDADAADVETKLHRTLAQARAGLESASAAWNERLRWLGAHAGELFERRERDRFLADIKAWRADPLASLRLFGQTALTAGWLKHFWSGILMGLASPVGLTFEQIRDLITFAGGDWRADRIDARCGGFMTLFLAISPDPEAEMQRWVAASLGLKRPGRRRRKPVSKASGEIDDQFETLMRRARLFHQPKYDREKARAALADVATKEYRVWSEKADTLMKQYEDEKARTITGPVPQDLGSAADIRETRRIQREMQRAERLVEKLERNLASLRRKHQAAARRQLAASTPQPAMSRSRKSAMSNRMNPGSTDPITDSPEPPLEILPEANRSSAETGTDSNSDVIVSRTFESSQRRKRTNPATLARAWRVKVRNESKQASSNRSPQPAGMR